MLKDEKVPLDWKDELQLMLVRNRKLQIEAIISATVTSEDGLEEDVGIDGLIEYVAGEIEQKGKKVL
ncbi:hypothetical protein L202_02988 [Cryptococcus amylolentus CBS 6039]|uniref:Uncharacterized protein n=1 Tax=Cryptococcus amylolentus CBS 6039 TaxID=1295533 RepID=A0A1E3HYN6_9TREE|nr:hypothetical protein L202_02988 [Cryptococcus amylolentus CBS 6039]ODN80846.1 hypothetical protein L202_02988 [Cryptococcus amylolentus CBS 6039]